MRSYLRRFPPAGRPGAFRRERFYAPDEGIRQAAGPDGVSVPLAGIAATRESLYNQAVLPIGKQF